MTDDDCVLTNQDLFDDEANDALALKNIEGAGGVVQPSEESCKGLGQP